MKSVRLYFDSVSARDIVGFSLCWAWIDAALVGQPRVDYSAGIVLLGDLASMVSVLSCILAYAVCYWSPRCSVTVKDRKVQWGVAMLASAGTALATLPVLGSCVAAAVFGLILVGVGMALLVLMWAEDYADDGNRRGHIWVAGSIALSFPVYLLAGELSEWLRFGGIAALPLLSCSMLRSSKGKRVSSSARRPFVRWRESDDGRTIEVLGFSRSLAFWFFSFGFVFGIMQHFSGSIESVSPTLVVFQQGGRALAAIVFFVGLCFLSWRPHTVYRVSTVIVLVGLILLPMFGSNNSFLAGFIAHAAYGFFECMTWAIVLEVMRQRKSDAGGVAGGARLLSALGLLLGSIIVVAARTGLSLDSLQMQSILSSAVCLLVVAVMTVLGNDRDSNVWAMLKSGETVARQIEDDGSALAIAELSLRYGLTEREREILSLLSEGRTSPYISKELLIGVNTVNTHKRRIYQKLGIHNKQELIDMVKGA